MNYFAGIDVSKATLDVTLLSSEGCKLYSKFSNNTKGYKQLLKWVNLEKMLPEQTLFCMENTGLYSRPLMIYLFGLGYKVWVVMPVEIKRSIGLQRGKNDKVDSVRIASYAAKHHSEADTEQPSEMIYKLKDWLSFRDRLIKQKQQLQQPVNEFADMGLTAQAKEMKRVLQPAINSIDTSIRKAEAIIRKLISIQGDMKRVYDLMLSVPGVGAITAWYLLAYSNGMRNFTNAKQLACYCGVAPFEHSSGTSVKARTRVSMMANKQLKSLLHLGALTIVKNKNCEMYQYYQRKVKEGKNKMSVINALRNKILQRIVSVINKDLPYSSKIAA
ncbi:IS110 family transposase [Mucilaginibacter sp. 21P]|uniref:IS110 family transposase n=1 Tax=Mucilaginibacter sp. 21P TaxID=2778902 RepID=UPI001C59500A|nr:IS110 family transposase [Mucilaginibacter sp. 21P]QXV64191.1 IS110 family transposase [Mucilaginibacter sp. 21P]QXV66494.1 IS110 family transposase [Mucilaginibacter sp. 21P]QXV66530.1 IS110 family transposase [Mucilaginibacter sp. 21P]